MNKIAVLLTCFNRKEKTSKCLESFYTAIEKYNYPIAFDIYLVDDGSTDGTSHEISTHFPEVHIDREHSNLFWARGMRVAWKNALMSNQDYDSFLLLNDDVILSEHFIANLLKTHDFSIKNYGQSGIYACSTQDPNTSEVSYGGKLIKNKGLFIRKCTIIPSEFPIPCSMANANILLVTKAVVDKIGILDPRFIHAYADYDYTLTAFEAGIPILVCPGIGGHCINDHGNNWLSSDTPIKARIKYLYSPKGLGYKEQIYYLKKHFIFQLPYYFIMLWLKTFFPIFWDKYKKSKD